MKVHRSIKSKVIGKRVWNMLRIGLLMMRKGVMSKRKLVMDMHLTMNKRGKVVGKSLSNLIFHCRHHSQSQSQSQSQSLRPRGFHGPSRVGDYEFSCSNSPNPLFFHVGMGMGRPPQRSKHQYYLNFPCINPPLTHDQDDDDDDDDDHQEEPSDDDHDSAHYFRELATEEVLSPLLLLSPFSNIIRVSNYSSEEEEDEGEDDEGNDIRRVDDEAEEFIRRFYEQLRIQSRIQVLQYEEEMQYREMLARGSG